MLAGRRRLKGLSVTYGVQPTPATRRLQWLLAGLDGAEGWGSDAAEVLAPEFAAFVAPARFVEVYRSRSQRFAPVSVILLEGGENAARAHLRDRAGGIEVLHCHVEEAAPHRITRTWMAPLVPPDLAARLPFTFAGNAVIGTDAGTDMGSETGGHPQLIVMTGVPGSGKSSVAEAVGRRLGIPVFAMDWLLGALTPFGGYHLDQQWEIGEELLTTLAFRQLALGQCAILDSPAEDTATRERWRSLADSARAPLRVVVCVCSDRELHRARVEERTRAIPGWHDAADWADVTRRLAAYPPWPSDALVVDTVEPLAECVARVVAFVGESGAVPGPTAGPTAVG